MAKNVYGDLEPKEVISEWESREENDVVEKAKENFALIIASIEKDGYSISQTSNYELFAKLIKKNSIIGLTKRKALKELGLD